MNDRLVALIFIVCALMAICVIAIVLAPSVSNPAGLPHPVIAGMQIGAGNDDRLSQIGFFAFSFQALLLLLIVCLCLLGVKEERRDSTLLAAMAGTYLFSLFVWWQMYFGLGEYYSSGQLSYFAGFPLPTAWQMYGTWFGSLPLIFIYCWGFHRYIYPPDEAIAFDQLLLEYKNPA